MTLQQIIDEEISKARKIDPVRIATKVANRLSDTEARETLALLLRQAVAQRLCAGRNVPARALTGEANSCPDTQQVGASRSERWEQVADWRSQPEFVGGEWKRIRDCTRDDVLELAARNRELEATHRENAERWEKVAALMDEYGAETVGALPAQIGAAA